jgi:sulfite reductase alpha subunit-like flavoprotein
LALQDQARLNLIVAFSRDGPKKVYVQHKIEERRDFIWELLDKKKANFYICGSDPKKKEKKKRFQ